MVYTSGSMGGQEVAADAVERDVSHGSEETVHQGLPTRYLRHGRAVSTLAARGESPAAFDRRCIPPGCVAPRSNTAGMLPRRALPDGRITALGATRDFHRGLLEHQSADRRQVGRPIRGRRPAGPAGASEAPARLLTRDRHRNHRGHPRAATHAPVLGRQEATRYPEEAVSAGPVAGPVDRL